MSVFELRPDLERYTLLGMVDPEDTRVGQLFDGRALASQWRPYEVSPIVEGDDVEEVGDFTKVGIIPVFSQDAVTLLGDMLRQNGELLPLVSREKAYLAYNVTTFVDALDVKRTQAEWLTPDRLLAVDRYVFIPGKLAGQVVFKIPQLRRGPVFVTGEFVERVLLTTLRGFEPRLIWTEAS